MEEINRQLLIKDICSRLPYGVYVKFKRYNEPLRLSVKDCLAIINGGKQIDDIQHLYLRPMSSMTEEEKEEYNKTFDLDYSVQGTPFDWLNAHHFDYRGLIEKGLALEAPKGMYKNK